jgi:hypothetical protein
MAKFRQWYLTYQSEITWFLNGLMLYGGIDSLTRGDYGRAVINFVFMYINYRFWRNHIK